MLQVSNLSFSYSRDSKLFEKIDINFRTNGSYIISGKNGSGKTTFLKLLSNIISLQSGTIEFKKEPIAQGMVSYMPSNPNSSFPHLTGEETLDLFSTLNHSMWPSSEWAEVLYTSQLFRTALKTQFYKCSTGMKQIINFSRTLTKKAPILLFDEPFNSLDEENRILLISLINKLSSNQLIIIASHFPIQLENSKMISLVEGKIKYD